MVKEHILGFIEIKRFDISVLNRAIQRIHYTKYDKHNLPTIEVTFTYGIATQEKQSVLLKSQISEEKTKFREPNYPNPCYDTWPGS